MISAPKEGNLMMCFRYSGILFAIIVLMGITSAGAGEVPRMTAADLNEILESPDLIILDVRLGQDWDASQYKIKGAARKDPMNFGNWKDELPKDKTIVLYCT